MRNIAIIPARSGSKGLKDKNIRLLNGKPLMWYSIQAAIKSGCFDTVMVSTDSTKYSDIAVACGAEVPFLRSDEQSGDNADSWKVVEEVLQKYRENGMLFDTVCLLQPTSPLRTEEDIINGYRLLATKSANAITGMCEMDHSPLWATVLPADHSLSDFRAHSLSVPRQKLDVFHRINGALYIRTIEYDENKIGLRYDQEYAYIMPRAKSIDIDVLEDFELAEWYLTKQ